jgi:hypothetical protein
VKRYNAGAMMIAAESLPELARLTQRLRETAGHQVDDQFCAQTNVSRSEGGSSTMPASWRSHSADPRWEIERGPGGDHDEPYCFEAPVSEATRRAWARLLARVHRERRDVAGDPPTF